MDAILLKSIPIILRIYPEPEIIVNIGGSSSICKDLAKELEGSWFNGRTRYRLWTGSCP